jgi:hypothetical protein
MNPEVYCRVHISQSLVLTETACQGTSWFRVIYKFRFYSLIKLNCFDIRLQSIDGYINLRVSLSVFVHISDLHCKFFRVSYILFVRYMLAHTATEVAHPLL